MDLRWNCGMRYKLQFGNQESRFQEHPRCTGTGIIKNVDPEFFARNKLGKIHVKEKQVSVICHECGQELNWFSGHFEEIKA